MSDEINFLFVMLLVAIGVIVPIYGMLRGIYKMPDEHIIEFIDNLFGVMIKDNDKSINRCPICGTANEQGAIYCEECGSSI